MLSDSLATSVESEACGLTTAMDTDVVIQEFTHASLPNGRATGIISNGKMFPSSSYCQHTRCFKHGSSKDARACLSCIQERRERLEEEHKHLPKVERDNAVYLRMGAGFCPACIKIFIEVGTSFVETLGDGTIRNRISLLR